MQYLFLASVLLAFVSVDSIMFKPCSKAQVFAPTNVEVTPCVGTPCSFKKGTSADVKIEFTAQDNQQSLTAAIYGIIAGIEIKFNMPNPDGCKDSGIACPIVKGTKYTYHSTFKVEANYPSIQVPVLWRMDGVNSTNVNTNEFCFTFLVKIVD